MDDHLNVIYKVVVTSNECSLTNKPKPEGEVNTLGTGIFRCTNAPCVGPSHIISTRPFTSYLAGEIVMMQVRQIHRKCKRGQFY